MEFLSKLFEIETTVFLEIISLGKCRKERTLSKSMEHCDLDLDF